MIIKIRDSVDIPSAHKTVVKLVNYLLAGPPNSGNSLSYKDLGFTYEECNSGENSELSPDMTSGAMPICRICEIRDMYDKKSRAGWFVAIETREEIYQSELFESDYLGGLPLWKVPRRMVEPTLSILRGMRAKRWQVSFRSEWVKTMAKSLKQFRTTGSERSWLIPPNRIHELFDQVGAFPVEKGVRIK